MLRVLLLALVATCQGFVLPSNVGAVAMRASEVASPVMFGGGGKAAAKKVVKKPVKKVVKKAAPKKVVKKVPVVRRGGSKTNVGASAQSFSSKIVSKENW